MNTNVMAPELYAHLTAAGINQATLQQLIEHLEATVQASGERSLLPPITRPPTASSTPKKQRASRKSRATSEKSRRPLNSYFAFRSFYSVLLKPGMEMNISGISSAWWNEDPFHDKWTVLARAYNAVRGDLSKEDAKLDDFLQLCAPLMDVIPADKYQELMGWKIEWSYCGDKKKDIPTTSRIFVPSMAQLPSEYTRAGTSIDNLVVHCSKNAYPMSTAMSVARNVQSTVSSSHEAGVSTSSTTAAADPTSMHLARSGTMPQEPSMFAMSYESEHNPAECQPSSQLPLPIPDIQMEWQAMDDNFHSGNYIYPFGDFCNQQAHGCDDSAMAARANEAANDAFDYFDFTSWN